MMKMTQFTVDEFFEFWPKLEEMLDALPHTWNRWTKEFIVRSVSADLTQVWGIGPSPKAVLILMTTVNVYPAMRVLSVVWAAGSFDDAMLPVLETTFAEYARLNDCSEVDIRGRMGWEPKLKGIGFTRSETVWTRKVPSRKLN